MFARSHSKNFRSPTSQPAFTLVELLVVIAIITLLAAVTMPTVRTLLHGQKVSQAARMVQAHIESARARAISSGSFAAVILERRLSTGSEYNSVFSLSIGTTFPPYEGDILGATGTLSDSLARNGAGVYASGTDGAYDQLTVIAANGSLITSDVFGVGDFIRIGGKENLFVITAKPGGSGAISFANPPYYENPLDGTQWPTREAQLPTTGSSTASFKIIRKPTKSFIQSTKLPRGACIDLSVSGTGVASTEYADLTAPLIIVFDERGSVVFVNNGTTIGPPSGLIQLLVGRTEQVAAAGARQSLADPNDRTTFTANLNDAGNIWVSINPRTGAVYTSAMQVGSETLTFSERLATARAFATNNVVKTAD